MLISNFRFYLEMQQNPWKIWIVFFFWKKKFSLLIVRFTCNNAMEPLAGHRLLSKTISPKYADNHFIDLGRTKRWVDHRATQWFWTKHLCIGNPAPLPLSRCFDRVVFSCTITKAVIFEKSFEGKTTCEPLHLKIFSFIIIIKIFILLWTKYSVIH